MLTVVYALVATLPAPVLGFIQAVPNQAVGPTGQASGWIWFWIAVVVLFVILFAWPGIGRRRRVGNPP